LFRVWAARNKFRYSEAAIVMTTFDLKFDPIDWQQLELLAKLTPGERMRASVMAHEFATALLRGTLRRRFPDLSLAELNMMVLRHCTEVRGMDP
jgi:hypothetical protein